MRPPALLFTLAASVTLVTACSSKPILQSDQAKDLGIVREYEKALTVKALPPPPEPSPTGPKNEGPVEKKPERPGKPTARLAKPTPTPPPKKFDEVFRIPLIGPRLPEIENAEGFDGRRPAKDPFRPGQKVVLALKYYNVVGGDMTIETLPFVEVNGRRAYHFKVSAKSNEFFSKFYAIDDYAETFMDFETMLPFNYEIHVRESKQLREIRSFIEWKALKSKYWEQKVTKDWGTENKELEWSVLPYSQNVFSAVFYLRTFALRPGMEVQMRVADEGRNMVVKGAVIRREKLETDIGDFDTVVMRPEIQMEGVFQPVGEILFWLTDDAYKQIVRIESKIRIGKIVGALKALERGQE